MSEDYLSVAEASERLAVSPRTIQRYCKQGRLNYKWVTGKRHREIRIIPPIPVGDLPGVKQKKDLGPDDFVSITDFKNSVDELRKLLLDQERRYDELSDKINELATALNSSSQRVETIQADVHEQEVISRAREIVDDFNAVRPVEKALILKMAREIKDQGEYLKTLGMDDAADD